MQKTKKNIRIKRHLSIIPHSPDSIELRSGVWNPTIYSLQDESKKGNLFKIIQDLNGEFSVADIVKRRKVTSSEIEKIIDHLHKMNVLEFETNNALDYYLECAIPAFLKNGNANKLQLKKPIYFLGDAELTNTCYRLLSQTFDENEMRIISDDYDIMQKLINSDDAWLHDGLLAEEMVDHFSELEEGFCVLLQKTINPIVSSKFNRISHHLSIPWIHAAIDGPFILIGPSFLNKSGCFDCFETRMMMNLRGHESYQNYKKAIVNKNIFYGSEFALVPALVNLLGSYVSLEVINFVLTESNFTQGKLLAIYLPTMEITFNEVLRYANCITCGAHQLKDGYQAYFDIHTLLGE